MALAPGTRLGVYEIVSPLGAGGMGEVYRAHDTKLDRDVAIKVLPDLFAADPERLTRFEREARTLAAFNHQNIAQVHGVIEQPPALVMELVDGEDLATRIARGPIPLDEAIPIARQIAEGLEAAHERGIIHRDLKPANIKVRDDGAVKVLDFGLAKAIADQTTIPQPVDNSPTFAAPAMTQMGVILGTAAYMPPEQAKGKPVDKRADIWAFGCVLFEMLTARRVFSGESSSELLAAVIMSEPELAELPRTVPPSLRRLIQRCLEKDPRQRLRDIGEARVMLTAPAVAEPLPLSIASPSRLTIAGWLTGGALIGAVLVWAFGGRNAAEPAAPLPEFSLHRLTELPGPELQPDISPNGRQILFASAASGNYDVYLLRVGGARPINLTQNSPAGDTQATFSPDGERIAFRSERDGGGIFIMGATGESVRRVTTVGFDPAWSPDGKFLAYSTEGIADPYARNIRAELWTVDVSTGKSRKLLDGDAVQPAWSHDGGRIAYWANTGGQRDLWTVDANGGPPVAVTQDAATDWSPEWSPDGEWLYFSSDRGGTMNLWRIAIDQRTGSPRGAAQAITSSLTGIGYARFAVDQRRLAVMAYSRSYELSLVPFDPSGGGKVGPTAAVRSPSLGWCAPSPAGDWLACTSRGAQEDIVLMRPDGSDTVRLMDDAWKDRNPTWSPDGTRISFMSGRSGEWELWSVRTDGSNLRQMTDLRSDLSVAVWSADGRQMMSSASTRPPTGLWIFDASTMATGETAKFFKNPLPQPFSAESWSPDGKLVAGSLLDTGGNPRTLAVWEVATGTVRSLNVLLPVTNDYFAVAGWLPDSQRFLARSGKTLALVDSTTGRWTAVGVSDGTKYGLAKAGRTLMVERQTLDADVWLMEISR
jgi:Tol biopolymer transport system component